MKNEPMGGEIRASQSASDSSRVVVMGPVEWSLTPYGSYDRNFLLCSRAFTAVKRMARHPGQLYLIRRGEALEHRRAAIPEWSLDAPIHNPCWVTLVPSNSSWSALSFCDRAMCNAIIYLLSGEQRNEGIWPRRIWSTHTPSFLIFIFLNCFCA